MSYYENLMKAGCDTFAPKLGGRLSKTPALYDLDVRFRIMDQFVGYRQIINIGTPPLDGLDLPLSRSRALARIGNEALAELVTRHPDRFVGFTACLPMDDLDASLEEYRYAVEKLGALGAQIYTNSQGQPMDRPEMDQLYELVAASGGVLQVHPCRNSKWPDYPTEERSKFEAWWSLGWEADLSVFQIRIVCSGVLERYPALKLLIHHGGSMIPHFAARINEGLSNIGSRTPDSEKEDVSNYSLVRPAIDYFRMMYADTSLSGSPHAVACAKQFYGTGHILFGTDTPYGPDGGAGYIRDAIYDVQIVSSDKEEERAIFSTNAETLFGLCR